MTDFYEPCNIQFIDEAVYDLGPPYPVRVAPYSKWKEAMLAALHKIGSTRSGTALFQSIKMTGMWIRARPLMYEACNANSTADFESVFNNGGRMIAATVRLEPHTYMSGSECFLQESMANSRWNHGKFPDEVLFHELVHACRTLQHITDNKALQGGLQRYDFDDEFFAIVLTNIYISDRTNRHSSGLRADHQNGRPLEKELSCSYTFYRSSPQTIKLMDRLANEMYLLCTRLAKVKAVFNPLAAYFENYHLAKAMSHSALAMQRERTVPKMKLPNTPDARSNAEIIGDILKDDVVRLLRYL